MLLSLAASDARCFAAIDGRHGLVVGAAAVMGACRQWPVPGPGVMIHVIPPCRGRGIGSQLGATLAEVVREQGMQAMYAARKSPEESEETLGWRRLGFTPCETVYEHQMPLDQFVPRLAPIVENWRRRGRIPLTARIIPLYAADRAEVLRLHLEHLGGDPESLSQKLAGRGTGAFHPRYSRVLMVEDRTVGCLLTHLEPRQAATVDANIVIPELRNGWANLWLKLEATQGALSLGITKFLFTTFDQYADTRSFSAKLGGVVTRKMVLMHRRLYSGG